MRTDEHIREELVKLRDQSRQNEERISKMQQIIGSQADEINRQNIIIETLCWRLAEKKS